MAEHYIHNRHSNTPTATDVPELAAIVVKDGAMQIGDGLTTLAALPKVGTTRRFELDVTTFTSVLQNITPTPEANEFWDVKRVMAIQVGGDTPFTDYTNNHKTFGCYYNIDSTRGNAENISITGAIDFEFVPALAEGAMRWFSLSAEKASHTSTVFLGKPIALGFSLYGAPLSTTKTSGGTGHAVNDVITMSDGCEVTVLTVSGGVVQTYSVNANIGSYTEPITQASTTGSGIGFALTVNTVTNFATGTGTLKIVVEASLETI